MAAFDSTQIARLATGLYAVQIGNTTMQWALDSVNGNAYGSVAALANALYTRDFGGMTNAAVASLVVANVGITTAAQVAEATTIVTNALNTAAAGKKGETVLGLLNGLATLTTASYAGVVSAFNTQVALAEDYAKTAGTKDVSLASLVPVFNLDDSSTIAGLQAMHLTGNQSVRINFSNTANQITGLDLNGNGTIDADGAENKVSGVASGFEAVDAYPRNPWNHKDTANNFLGNIEFDGRSYQGDGVKTNGNIVLGGLGNDTIYGGVGNDFLAGGGIAKTGSGDYLSGGRNADFFFAEFSAIGNPSASLTIDGGNTADDISAGNTQSKQDTDWLLLEANDDDEPVQIWLNDDNLADQSDSRVHVDPVTGGATTESDGRSDSMGRVLSRAGDSMLIDDVENVDASGNLYGFLDNIDVLVGKRATDDRAAAASGANYGYGSAAQLWVSGSNAANIVIGGYDNDYINGRGGDDLLMGGNLNALHDPNLSAITNNGRDELVGGDGADNIVFETDGGIYEGGTTYNANDTETDTLWLTANTFGTQTATTVTSDGFVRLDLGVGKEGGLNNYAGYGGADLNAATTRYTSDQTLYKAGYARTQVQDMESVIATGLGAVDYLAAGANSPNNASSFANQQNHLAYVGNLDLRGTTGANTLYAAAGTDTIEGRQGGTLFFNEAGIRTDGRDKLSGGDGLDTFVFGTMDGSGSNSGYGDNIDIIHRQTDANNDNIWDGTFEQDFGKDSVVSQSASALRLTLNVSAADTVSNPLVQNDVLEIRITVAGAAKVLTTDKMAAAATMADLLVEVQAALTTLGDANLSATLSGNTISIIHKTGAVLGGQGYIVAQNSGGSIQNVVSFEPTIQSVAKDVLLYKAYEDRADNEAVNDNTKNGSSISLGDDSYAQDRVVSFQADGTRIAEDQQYRLVFNNVTTQDVVTIKVNGVQYQLTAGVDLDGNPIANEDITTVSTAGFQTGTTAQQAIQHNFLVRLSAFIDSFMDVNTAAGSVDSATDTTDIAATGGGTRPIDTLVLTQNAYGNGVGSEATVFMVTPEVSIANRSGGEVASWYGENRANHEVLLYNFDGKNGNLNDTNVKFIGDTGQNRSLLATAKNAGETLVGYEASVVNGGANDLAATVTNTSVNAPTGTTAATVEYNTNTNPSLQTNFAVHGDDLLMGGDGNDTIFGRTGDDRIIGSKGLDTVDGGKNWYAVQILNESTARVVEMNAWEAASPAARVSALSGLTVVSTTQILQSENGTGLKGLGDGVNSFDDTLQFQQADFGAAARFLVTVGSGDFSVATTGSGTTAVNTIALPKGGAGTVDIDVAGDGAWDVGQKTTFSNFENIRTVSGTGKATAGNNQGFDTLNVTALSNVVGGVGGIRYELSNDATAGELRYDQTVAAVAATAPQAAANFALASELIMSVDGVENVISGTGKDYLIIDETEAAKNNRFEAGDGVDLIEYRNQYDNTVNLTASTSPATAAGDTERAAQPVVTIKVNTATNTDEVTMTNGRVGATGATDTPTDVLVSVEHILLNNNTARGAREADTLDVTAVGGATVDYTNGEVRLNAAADGTAGAVQVTIGSIAQLENVVGGTSDDTVILASSATMAANATTDDVAVVANRKDLGFSTFLDYDELNTSNGRVAFTSLTAGANDAGAGKIEDWMNQGQFKINLAGTGVDTVDYGSSTDAISVRVEMDPAVQTQRVLVDGSGGTFDATLASNDRIDELTGVERIVAAQGESILDLTQATVNTKVEYSKLDTTKRQGTLDRDVYSVVISDNTDSTRPVALARTFLEYRDAGQSATVTVAPALWTRVEGSDMGDTIVMSSAHSVNGTGSTNTMNLRGGANEVKYNELTKSISLSLGVTDFVATAPLTTGLITGTVTFQDGNGINAVGPTLANSGTHTITSYTANNPIDAKNTDSNTTNNSSLTIVASVDAEDALSLTGTTDKVFLLAEQGTTDNQITVRIGAGAAQNSIVLKGFELLTDSSSNDVYNMGNLANVVNGLTFTDAAGDHDAIVVPAGVTSFNGSAANTLDLDTFNATKALGGFGVEFDVLDVTNNTTTGMTFDGTVTADASDELVVGVLSRITTITNFESLVATEATVAGGSSFTLNTQTNVLSQGSTNVNYNGNVLSFGGLVFEGELNNSYLAAATTGVNVTTVDVLAEGVQLVGGAGADTLSGSAGNDKLLGGAGNDVLNAGTAAEVRSFDLQGQLANAAGQRISFNWLGQGNLTLAEAAVADATDITVPVNWTVVDGAGTSVVLSNLANLLNGNLSQVNADWQTVYANPQEVITKVEVSGTSLVFTFQSGFNAANAINLGYAANGDTGTFTVSAETTVANGGTGGNNVLRGGEGTDTHNGGAGNDTLVVVGSVTANQATTYGATYATQAAVDAVVGTNVIARSELTSAHTSTDVATGDVYNGGAGFDTLHLFGTADLSGSTINADVEMITAHSIVTLTATQLAAMVTNGQQLRFVDAASTLTITGLATTVASLDLSAITSTAGGLTVILPGVTAVTSLVTQGAAPITLTTNGTTAIVPAGVVSTGAAVYGTSGADALAGTTGAETLWGYDGNDTLTPGAGADVANGGAGTDTLSYADVTLATSHGLANLSGVAINNSGSTVTAATVATDAGGTVVIGGGNGVAGADLANGSAAYLATTAANSTTTMVRDTFSSIESFLGSSLNDVMYGGSTPETFNGGAGNDFIKAGAGNDSLTGGTGIDSFVFTGVTAASNGSDTIADFVPGTDRLVFSLASVNAATAGGLVAGAVAAGNIVIAAGAAAGDANDYFLYNLTTGTLSFDADGNGAGAAVVLATLTGAPVITAADVILG